MDGGSRVIVEEFTARLTDWRALLEEQSGQANRLLRQVLVGKLRMTPGEEGYHFRGTGTVQPIVAGLVPHDGVPNACQLEPDRYLASANRGAPSRGVNACQAVPDVAHAVAAAARGRVPLIQRVRDLINQTWFNVLISSSVRVQWPARVIVSRRSPGLWMVAAARSARRLRLLARGY